MGKPSKFPPGPITSQTLEGREQFRKLFKRWSRQWSQPGLIKLSEVVLGDRVLHSSQISGFATGTLKDPAPKVLLALGRLNLALAERKYPAGLGALVEQKDVMRTTSGEALGPAEMFLAFVGELDLGLPDVQEIPLEDEESVNKAFGKWLRGELAKRGVDFVVEDRKRLIELTPAMEGLLTGVRVNGDLLIEGLPAIAGELGVGEAELWDVIQAEITTHLPE
jgi:hypothetical protein